MVVDTTYYDLLKLQPSATSLEIKKAYRKAAIKLHPDKNPDDPQAAARFQEVGEAYQVLSDDTLRAKYDKFGKQESIPQEGFEDPSEFFSMIFGGEAFKDWIGELSLLQELSKSAELSGYSEEDDKKKEKEAAEKSVPEQQGDASFSTYDGNYDTSSSPFQSQAEPRASSNHKSYGSIHAADHSDVSNLSSNFQGTLYLEGAEGNAGEPAKKELTKEEIQELKRKEELEKFEEECRLKKIETRKELTRKLIDRLSLFTETDMKDDVARSFQEKMRYEAESLKMESFGLEILHTLGYIYKTKSKIFLKNQTFFGWGGFWTSVKEKGGVVKDTFKTVSSALDAQKTMQEYTKMQEDNEYHAKQEAEGANADPINPEEESAKAAETKLEAEEEAKAAEEKVEAMKKIPEKHTPEEIAEMEKYLMGKVLAAAWSGSKFEIQGTVRGVCDNILDDKDVPLETRVARAKALRLVADVFIAATRTEAEEEDARVFEELVAEASKKREKKKPAKDTPAEPSTAV